MSVLIRGMDEIPGDGVVLVVKHDDNGKVYIKYANTYGYSMELLKIPESHGDLIDRNDLKKEYAMGFDCNNCVSNWKSCQHDAIYAKMDFCLMLDDAPVVIEAEDEDD